MNTEWKQEWAEEKFRRDTEDLRMMRDAGHESLEIGTPDFKLIRNALFGDSINSKIKELPWKMATELREDISVIGTCLAWKESVPVSTGDIIVLDPGFGILPQLVLERGVPMYVVGSLDKGDEDGPDQESCDLVPVSQFRVPAFDGEQEFPTKMKEGRGTLVLQGWNTMLDVGTRALYGGVVGKLAPEAMIGFLSFLEKAEGALPIFSGQPDPDFQEYWKYSRRYRDLVLQRLGGVRYRDYTHTAKAEIRRECLEALGGTVGM